MPRICWKCSTAEAAPGVTRVICHQKDLDEAPGSYKDIEAAMENQSDLVAVEVSLPPLAVIKG
jgi:tRNA-splicing ligase RtcB